MSANNRDMSSLDRHIGSEGDDVGMARYSAAVDGL
jgi:hypothetical protein